MINLKNGNDKPYKNRFINLMKVPGHDVCLPCCGKRSFLEDDGSESKECIRNSPDAALFDKNGMVTILSDDPLKQKMKDENDQRYIMKDEIPVSKHRYGILPFSILTLFQSKMQYCGKQSSSELNKHGLIQTSTDCLVHKGVDTKQPYLSSLVEILNHPEIKNVKELQQTIVNNLSVLEFLSLNKGNIYRYFIDSSIDKTNLLNEYKIWITKNTKGKEYIDKFNLHFIKNSIYELTSLNETHPLYITILRELYIFQSYRNFINYIIDDEIIKDHLFLNDLINRE